MIQVEVSRVFIIETSASQVVVLREKDGTRSFSMAIGVYEAMAIDRRARSEEFERPLTHDLVTNVIDGLSATLDRMEITALKQDAFHANLILHTPDGKEARIDSRPSDAIAVSLRYNAPIYVHKDILAHAGKDENIIPMLPYEGEMDTDDLSVDADPDDPETS